MQDSLINAFTGGMNLDTVAESLEASEYRYAKDISLKSFNNFTAVSNCSNVTYLNTGITGKTLATAVTDYYDNDTIIRILVVLSEDLNSIHHINAYAIDDDDLIQYKLLLHKEVRLDVDEHVKLIGYFDSAKATYLYITSGNGVVHSLNLKNEYSVEDNLELFPSVGALPPPIFWNMEDGGSLPFGYVRYFYLFLDLWDNRTALSALSVPICVWGNDELNAANSGKKVTVKIELSDNVKQFDRIRVYRAQYGLKDQNGLFISKIYKIFDKKISQDDSFILITDSENTPETVIDIADVNKSNIPFKNAKTIAVFKNRMYYGNISESNVLTLSFDDFDTRAYRSDKSGNVLLRDWGGDINCKLQEILDGSVTIDVEADALNPYVKNLKDTQYQYTTKFNSAGEFGGSGINIDYAFVRIPLNLQGVNPNHNAAAQHTSGWVNIVSESLQREHKPTYKSTKYKCSIHNNDALFADGDMWWADIPYTMVDHSYEDAYFISNFKSYKQGEIYPFGIVFYDKHHNASNVLWIGDIKIPYFNQGDNLNIVAARYWDGGTICDCLSYAIGLRFRVNLKNMPAKFRNNICAFEIVRCDRNLEDRTILYQGLGSRLFEQYTKKMTDDDVEIYTPGLYPTSLMMSRVRRDAYSTRSGDVHPSEKLFSITSPDVHHNIDFLDYLTKAKCLLPVTYLTSFMFMPLGGSPELLVPYQDENTKLLRVYTHIGAAYDYNRVNIVDPNTYKDARRMSGAFYSLTISDKERNNPLLNTLETMDRDDSLYSGLTYPVSDLWYKYYTPVDNNNPTQFIDIESAISLHAWDPNVSAKNIYDRRHVVGNLGVSNLAMLLSPGTDFINSSNTPISVTRGSGFGAGSRKFVFFGEFSSGKLNPFGEAADTDEGNVPTPGAIRLNGISYTLNGFSKNFTISNQSTGSFYKMFSATAPIIDVYTDLHNQYGGFDYEARTNRAYVSIGCYQKVNAVDQVYAINCFGGDTVVGLYHDLWSGLTTNLQLSGGRFTSTYRTARVSFPVESNIDMYRTVGENLTDSENLNNRGVSVDPVEFNDGTGYPSFTQQLGLFGYTTRYTSHPYPKLFVAPGLYETEEITYPYRVLCSEVKSHGEVTDSFKNIDPMSYIDCPREFGQVTNLVSTEKTLFVFQNDAVGSVLTEYPSIMQDENNVDLKISSSAVLNFYAYIAKIQSDIINTTAINTDNGIELAESSPMIITKDAIIDKASATNTRSHFLNISKQIHIGNHPNHQEMWYCSDDSETIIFDKMLHKFTTFRSDRLKYFLKLNKYLIGISETNQLGIISESPHQQTCSNGYLEFVVNKYPDRVKVFDTIVIQDSGNPNKNSTLVVTGNCETNRQGRTSLETPRNIEGDYYYSIGRSDNLERMRDRKLIATLTLSGEFSIAAIKTVFRN